MTPSGEELPQRPPGPEQAQAHCHFRAPEHPRHFPRLHSLSLFQQEHGPILWAQAGQQLLRQVPEEEGVDFAKGAFILQQPLEHRRVFRTELGKESLRPLDTPAILASLAKTHRVVVVDEGWRTGSLAAEVSARIMEGGFYDLDVPVARVCSAEVPMPYPKHLEDAALPQAETIVATVRGMLRRRG